MTTALGLGLYLGVYPTHRQVGRMPNKEEFETSFTYTDLVGLEYEEDATRRDPSDVIRARDLYYVWYTKTDRGHSGYDATVWYATSADGRTWAERGEAVPRGDAGEWDEQSVFTPGILVADGRYYLFYTSVEKPFSEQAKTAIGFAAADSPDGPWTKSPGNPVVTPGQQGDWDSHRVDDSCLLIRRGECWLYYKGRQMGLSPAETKMGVAIADRPEGPYIKSPSNPLIGSGHEVLVWPHREGVAALLAPTGPQGKTVQYSPNGLHFAVRARLDDVPRAPGAYRPNAFTDTQSGLGITWGICQRSGKGGWPYLQRFDCDLTPKTPGD